MNYKIDKPYPEVLVEKPNIYYAKLLLNNYAGSISEETAVHLYFYQSLITKEDLPDFSKAIMTISKVEMLHLRLLGEAIKLLGVKPIFGNISRNKLFKHWNSENVNYTTNLKKMLEFDIKSETEAILNYQKVLKQIKDEDICKLIIRIIEDEQLHLKIFRDFYQKYVILDN